MNLHLLFLASIVPVFAEALTGVFYWGLPSSGINIPKSTWECFKSKYNATTAAVMIWGNSETYCNLVYSGDAIVNAHKAGFQVEGWISASSIAGCSPNQIYDSIFNHLDAYGAKIGRIWLDVYPTQPWHADPNVNINFIRLMVTEGQKRGHEVGIKTGMGFNTWETNFANTAEFSSLPLWYLNRNYIPSFADFQPFAGWTKAIAKEYGNYTTNCEGTQAGLYYIQHT